MDLLYETPLQRTNGCPIGDLEVAFIIDSSGSMVRNDKERLRVSKSEEFIEALSAPKNIAARFNSNGYLLSSSPSVSYVKSTFNLVGQSGGTNIGDGLEKAFNAFSPNHTGQKIAILLTDGKSSESKINAMLTKAKDENIKIFTIGLGSPAQLNEALLLRLAKETGGQYYHVAENIDIGTAYQSILSDITCGVPVESCALLSQAFSSPTIEYTNSDVFMYTDVKEACGEIAKVVLRFDSYNGYLDYELVDRGQNHFKLRKGLHEVSNFALYEEGEFLAYDRYGSISRGKTCEDFGKVIIEECNIQ